MPDEDGVLNQAGQTEAPEEEEEALQFDLMGEESRRLAAYWKDQIKQVDDVQHRWLRRGRMIERRYRDERSRVDEEGTKRYAALWSNVDILYPAVYGRTPVPICERRFRDKDPAGRGAAEMLERALRSEIEINGFGEAIGQGVLDYLLPGRGQVWVRYEPEVEEGVSIPAESDMDLRDARGDIEKEDSSETEKKFRNTGDRVVRESVPVDYINWADFRTFPAKARVWREVVAGSKTVGMSRDQMKRRFGKEIGDKIPLQREDQEARAQRGRPPSAESEAEDKGQVTEIWCRTDETVYWIAEGYDYLCDKLPDPLKLEEFFPFPRPICANSTNSTLVPVADYMMYQDQALQIDQLVQRIDMLCRACKVAGVYNSAAKDIMRLFDESVENELIPVDAWAAFADKGGVAGQISMLPLKEIIGVIQELQTQLEKTMALMDRLTGITDIMRGTGDPRETLGGQRLKTNNGGTRLTRRQNEVARFCRDVVRIMADIMATHFSPQSLIEASGALLEEGLGVVDMPPLSALQGSAPLLGAAPVAPTPALQGPQGGALPVTGQPASLPPSPGLAGQSPGGAVPPVPPGASPTNIVPFPGPGGAPLGGLPNAQPGGTGFAGQMAPPAMPPELLAKFQALQRIADAIKLLRNERLRGFRVDIEVDTTIFGDAAQEKADRIEFLGSVTKFLEAMAPLGTQVPELIPLMGKMLQFGTRGFRVGRDLESAISDAMDELVEASNKRKAMPPQPNPAAEKDKALADKARADAQGVQQRNAIDAKKGEIDLQVAGINAQSDQDKAQAEVRRQEVEAQSEAANSQADLQQAGVDLEMRKLEMQIEHMRLQIEFAKLQGQAAQQAHERAMPAQQQGAGGL